jgi:hypothetical protein
VPDRTDPGSGPVTSQPSSLSEANRGVTAAGLARRDFPAGLDTSTTWIASPQDSSSAFHQRLAEAIESGIDERRAFSGGAIALLVELVPRHPTFALSPTGTCVARSTRVEEDGFAGGPSVGCAGGPLP